MRLAKHNLRSEKASPFCSLWCVRYNWKCPRVLAAVRLCAVRFPFFEQTPPLQAPPNPPFRGRIALLLSERHNGSRERGVSEKLAFSPRASRFVAALCKYLLLATVPRLFLLSSERTCFLPLWMVLDGENFARIVFDGVVCKFHDWQSENIYLILINIFYCTKTEESNRFVIFHRSFMFAMFLYSFQDLNDLPFNHTIVPIFCFSV